MRAAFICLCILSALSCTKSGGNSPAPPPADTTVLKTYNFGKIVDFTDSLKVYDANTGALLTRSMPYGTLVGSGLNNTVVDDSLVYQLTFTRLLAMNIRTGKPQFGVYFSYVYYSFGGVSSCFPVIDGANMYAAAFNTAGEFKLFCINKFNGQIVWQSQTALSYETDLYASSLVQTPTTILIQMYNGPACFEKSTGKLVWQNNSSAEYAKLGTTPMLAGDKFITVSRKNHAAYAFNINNGSLAWKAALPSDRINLEGYMHNYGNVVYIQSRTTNPDGKGYTISCIDTGSGQLLKSIELPDAYWYVHFDQSFFYTFNKTQKTFFPQRINKHLLSTGNIIWTKDLEGGVNDGFTTTPDFIYCTEVDPINTSSWQKMNIMDQANGKTLNVFPIYANVPLRSVVIDSLGKVYTTPR